MNSTLNESDEVSGFYSWIRDYWTEISRSREGEENNVLNFGYWQEEGDNLFDAQMNFFRLILGYLGAMEDGAHGIEIGCGIGGYAVALLNSCPVRLTCFDLLDEHLELTKEYAREKGVADRLESVQGNAMDMQQFSDNELDFGYCIESSFHYDEKQKFFNEVYRVMKPNGIFVFADISCEDTSGIGFKSGNYFSTQSELDRHITESGFRILEHKNIGDQVFGPLYKYVKNINATSFSGRKKPKVARYWELVTSNYAQLCSSGKMGYQVFRLQK